MNPERLIDDAKALALSLAPHYARRAAHRYSRWQARPATRC